MYKTSRAKATDIPADVRKAVKQRDNSLCIFCQSSYGIELAHTILSRSKGGLGIEQNLVCACQRCHKIMDSESEQGKRFRQSAIRYLEKQYGRKIDREEVRYAKGKTIHV